MQTEKGKVQEWLNWPAWKASKRQKRFKGSNPFLSAKRKPAARNLWRVCFFNSLPLLPAPLLLGQLDGVKVEISTRFPFAFEHKGDCFLHFLHQLVETLALREGSKLLPTPAQAPPVSDNTVNYSILHRNIFRFSFQFQIFSGLLAFLGD